VSKSRAKKKQRQRARGGREASTRRAGVQDGASAPRRVEAVGGARGRGGAPGAAKAQGAAGRPGAAEARGAAEAPGVGDRPSRLDVRDGVARPRPVWAPFPLTEIGMAVGIVLFGVGFESDSTSLLTIAAIMLAVVVGELCLREHFAGFRSHALLLAALAVVSVHALVFLALTDAYTGPLSLAVDLGIGGALAWLLHGRYAIAHERARDQSEV
jgi:hypothetical protein